MYSDYQVHVMKCVPYVSKATHSRATVMTQFMFKKKKKKKFFIDNGIKVVSSGGIGEIGSLDWC
jgi:hypothetical protein